MRYTAVALDFDGTIAHDSVVPAHVIDGLKRLKETGTTVLISEQNLRFATELADRVSIIERGEIRYEGTPAELAARPEVREKYLMV